jgi:hypothetical protein
MLRRTAFLSETRMADLQGCTVAELSGIDHDELRSGLLDSFAQLTADSTFEITRRTDTSLTTA